VGSNLCRRIPLCPREITPLYRDAFGFRGHDRRSEASAEAEPGRKAGTDRRITVGTTVTEGIPEGFRPAKPERIAPGGLGAKHKGLPVLNSRRLPLRPPWKGCRERRGSEAHLVTYPPPLLGSSAPPCPLVSFKSRSQSHVDVDRRMERRNHESSGRHSGPCSCR
jgi:hypothetical protein